MCADGEEPPLVPAKAPGAVGAAGVAAKPPGAVGTAGSAAKAPAAVGTAGAASVHPSFVRFHIIGPLEFAAAAVTLVFGAAMLHAMAFKVRFARKTGLASWHLAMVHFGDAVPLTAVACDVGVGDVGVTLAAMHAVRRHLILFKAARARLTHACAHAV